MLVDNNPKFLSEFRSSGDPTTYGPRGSIAGGSHQRTTLFDDADHLEMFFKDSLQSLTENTVIVTQQHAEATQDVSRRMVSKPRHLYRDPACCRSRFCRRAERL